MTEPQKHGRSFSGAAIAGCLFLVLMQCGTLVSGGVSRFVHFIEEGGIFMLLVLALYVLGAVTIAALGALRLRGREIPLAALVVPPLLPLAAGLLGSRIAISQMTNVVRMVDPASRASLLARGTSEALLLGMMGTASAATLLACTAWVVSLEGPRARLAKRSPIGTIGMPLVWLGVAAAALVVGAMLHPDGQVGLRALSMAFVAAALASGVAGSGFGQPHEGDTPADRAIGAAFAVPALGVAIAYLMAYQLRLTQGMMMFSAVAGADASSRLLMMDQGLYEADEAFQASLWLIAGPLAAMGLAVFLGRRSLARILSAHRATIGAAAAVLVLTMGAAAVTQATFVVAIVSIAGGGAIELPATNATLPRVQTDDVITGGPIVIIDDEVRVEGNTLGPRAILNQAEALRSSMADFQSLVVFADESVTAGQLVGLLSATVDDEYPLDVQVAVDSGPPSRPMRGPLRDLPSSPPAVVFSFLSAAAEGPRLHIALDGLTLHQSGRASSVSATEVGMMPAIVTAEATVPLGRLLEVLTRFGYGAQLAPMPPGQAASPETSPETASPESPR